MCVPAGGQARPRSVPAGVRTRLRSLRPGPGGSGRVAPSTAQDPAHHTPGGRDPCVCGGSPRPSGLRPQAPPRLPHPPHHQAHRQAHRHRQASRPEAPPPCPGAGAGGVPRAAPPGPARPGRPPARRAARTLVEPERDVLVGESAQRAEHGLAQDRPHDHALDQILPGHPALYVPDVDAGHRLGRVRVLLDQVDQTAVPDPAQRRDHPGQRLGGRRPLADLPVAPPQQFGHVLPGLFQLRTALALLQRCDPLRRRAEHLEHRLRGVVGGFQDLPDGGEREAAHLQQDPDQAEAPLMAGAVLRLVGAGQLPGGQQPFPYVVLDRRHRHPGPATQFTDAHRAFALPPLPDLTAIIDSAPTG